MAQNTQISALLFTMISTLWGCYNLLHLPSFKAKGAAVVFSVIVSVFVVQSVMAQIETLFFGSAFQEPTRSDAVWIVISGLIPVTIVSALAVVFFKQKTITRTAHKFIGSAFGIWPA